MGEEQNRAGEKEWHQKKIAKEKKRKVMKGKEGRQTCSI